ncbi:MAG: class I SAM-dependent methyltransferase [Thermomicrobiales bacterium]
MTLRVRPLVTGIATYVPGVNNLISRRTGGSDSARYCYSVWLRHLVMARAHDLPAQPAVVAELGPGDSLGVGLAALLSGAAKYYAFDVVRYARNDRDLAIFDELVALFRARAPIPGPAEFPLVTPLLDDYAFPHDILTENRLTLALASERVAAIRAELAAATDEGEWITYQAPWDRADIVREGTVDMVISQTVMEYPLDLHATYGALHRWLKPGGVMSHQIDFRCLGTAREWNGHWACSDFAWALVTGKRRYPVGNREPHSTHRRLMEERGFRVVGDVPIRGEGGLPREALAQRFRNLTDDDLTTSIALIQAIKAA